MIISLVTTTTNGVQFDQEVIKRLASEASWTAQKPIDVCFQYWKMHIIWKNILYYCNLESTFSYFGKCYAMFEWCCYLCLNQTYNVLLAAIRCLLYESCSEHVCISYFLCFILCSFFVIEKNLNEIWLLTHQLYTCLELFACKVAISTTIS